MSNRQWQALIKDKYQPGLYNHSLAVAETAASLAECYGADPEKAFLAGLLHDYGKSFSRREMLCKAEQYGVVLDYYARKEAKLLHAPIGAALVWCELKIKDPELSLAILYHTTGHPKLSLLAMILYLADGIEPGRNYKGIELIRSLAYVDLDQALLLTVTKTIQSILGRGLILHPRSVAFRNSLILKCHA